MMSYPPSPPSAAAHPPAPPPRPPQRRTGLIVGLSVGAVVLAALMMVCLAAVLFSLGDDEPAAGSSPGAEVTPSPVVDDEPLGDDLRLEIAAELVEFEAANRFDDSEHTSVRVEVTNTSDERVYVGPLDWFGTDVDGFKHEPSYRRHADGLSGLYLDPGQSVAGVVTFPGEVELASIAYQRWPSDEPVEVPVG